MKSIFISIPMQGRAEEAIKAEMAVVAYKVQKYLKENVTVVESCDNMYARDRTAKNKPVFYLGRSLEAMSRADIVVFATGWDAARGCTIEHNVALNYGMKILYEWEIAGGGKNG